MLRGNNHRPRGGVRGDSAGRSSGDRDRSDKVPGRSRTPTTVHYHDSFRRASPHPVPVFDASEAWSQLKERSDAAVQRIEAGGAGKIERGNAWGRAGTFNTTPDEFFNMLKNAPIIVKPN